MELRRRDVESSQVHRPAIPPEEPPVRVAVRQRRVFRSPVDLAERWYWLGLVTVTVAAILTRFYTITEPRHVA